MTRKAIETEELLTMLKAAVGENTSKSNKEYIREGDKRITRKFKDYVNEENNCIYSIFGSIYSRDCLFVYRDENGKWNEYRPSGIYKRDMSFLYEYYVRGISPRYEIKNDKIISYLYITLVKNLKE